MNRREASRYFGKVLGVKGELSLEGMLVVIFIYFWLFLESLAWCELNI